MILIKTREIGKVIIYILFFSLESGAAQTAILPPFKGGQQSEYQLKEQHRYKGKVYLISSSSQYDEKIIPEIAAAFSRQGYVTDTKYLEQNPTQLGYVNIDENRASTLIKALSDKNVKYLWFVKGGSGALNLYPALYANLDRISASTPKVIIGFSDVTAIHNFVNHELNWPSVHGVLASYNMEMHEIDKKKTLNMDNSLNEVFQTLSHGITYTGIESMNRQAIKIVSGKLDGGNLTLVQSLFSTSYESSYSEKVMMLEDTGVTAKQLDRTLHQIEYSRTFRPRAVIFGQFYSLNAGEEEKSLYRYVIQQFADRVNYPVYYYPEFGHGKTNQPFIMAHRVKILCNRQHSLCSLTQPPVV